MNKQQQQTKSFFKKAANDWQAADAEKNQCDNKKKINIGHLVVLQSEMMEVFQISFALFILIKRYSVVHLLKFYVFLFLLLLFITKH